MRSMCIESCATEAWEEKSMELHMGGNDDLPLTAFKFPFYVSEAECDWF